MQNADWIQGQNPLCLYWPSMGNVLWAIASTHLGPICLYYVTPISSLSFSQPLLETLAAVSPTLPPFSSNLRQFGDNYSLLEEMWLALNAAYWVGKTAGKKGDFHISFGKQNAALCGWLWGAISMAAALLSSELPAKKWACLLLYLFYPLFSFSLNQASIYCHSHTHTK